LVAIPKKERGYKMPKNLSYGVCFEDFMENSDDLILVDSNAKISYIPEPPSGNYEVSSGNKI